MKKIRLLIQSTTKLHCFYPCCLELWDLFFSRTTSSYVIDFSPSFLHMGMKGVGGAIFWIPAIVSELSCITKFESALWQVHIWGHKLHNLFIDSQSMPFWGT